VKKIFLLACFVLLFCGSAFAASEEDILLLSADYGDGAEIPDITAIEPYRPVRLVFQFQGAVDKASVLTKTVLPRYTETIEAALPPAEGKRVIVECELPSGLELTLIATGHYGNDVITSFFPIKAREGERPGVPVTGIGLLLNPAETPQTFIRVTLEKGVSEKIYYQIEPEHATNKNVTIESSDSNVAEISDSDESSTTVTAKKKGKTYVSFTAKDGGFTATCEVTVTETSTGGGGGCNANIFGGTAVGGTVLLAAMFACHTLKTPDSGKPGSRAKRRGIFGSSSR
jgi:hypothetical protein